MTDLSRDMERELAALADGSLAPGRRERALARASGSRELQDALAEQRRAVELMAGVEVEAPASLHKRVESVLEGARREHSSATRHIGFLVPRIGISVPRIGLATPRIGISAAIVAALAAGAIAIGLIGGAAHPASSGLNVQQAAALTLSPATMGAPAESTTNHAQLAASVGGVPFPYWEERFGWRGSGARSDRLAGRFVTTVFYTNARGRRIGYAIVSGRAPATHGGRLVRRWGVSYRLLTHEGVTVVVWQRAGHLCVVSGRNVNARTLLSLASWGSEPRTA
jgi:hypothetical protein